MTTPAATTSDTAADIVAPIASILTDLGFKQEQAVDVGYRFQSELEDVRNGWSYHTFNRAHLIEHLRIAYCHRDGNETRKARTALERIEQEVFHGVRVPASEIRDRFCATSLSIWDRELNRWWCYSCQNWVDYDGHHPFAAWLPGT